MMVLIMWCSKKKLTADWPICGLQMQVVSDIHLEFFGSELAIVQELIQNAGNARYLVLAGDICTFAKNGGRIKLFLSALKAGPWERIFYVPGNHEYYSVRSIDHINNAMLGICAEIGIDFLLRTRIELPECILLGTTLWGNLNPNQITSLSQGLNDFRKIRKVGNTWHDNVRVHHEQKLSFFDYLSLHSQDVAWLKQELSVSADKPIYVITHHPPIQVQANPDELDSAYNGDVGSLLPKVDTWIFGHNHAHYEQVVNGCHLVSNPRGYSNQIGQIGYIAGWSKMI